MVMEGLCEQNMYHNQCHSCFFIPLYIALYIVFSLMGNHFQLKTGRRCTNMNTRRVCEQHYADFALRQTVTEVLSVYSGYTFTESNYTSVCQSK
jgi:hypothetical protein